MKIVTFPRKKGETQHATSIDDFLLEKDTFRKIMEINEKFFEQILQTTTTNPGNRRGFSV